MPGDGRVGWTTQYQVVCPGRAIWRAIIRVF